MSICAFDLLIAVLVAHVILSDTTTAYLLSKLLVEVPLTIIQMMVQWLLVVFMMDLQGNYFQLVASAFGLAMTSNSLAMILGAGLSDVKEVTELSSLLFVPQILFAGFFIRLNQIPVFLRWAQYLCGMSYAIKLVFTIEFNGNLHSCNENEAAHQNCHALLKSNGLDNDLIWISVILLFVIFLVARAIAGYILTEKAKSFY
jgi:hypothetical protein